MLEIINTLIEEAKDCTLKPKYMVVSYNTSKFIPYKTNAKGIDTYKGLKLQIWATCPDNMVYFHNYNPKCR